MMLDFKNKNLWLKRAAYAFLIIVTASLQNTKGAVFAPFGVHAMLPVVLTVCIAIHEKSLAALFFGTFAGIMWDMTSVATDGYYAVVLAVVGFVCSLLITFEMRRNIYSAILLVFGSSFVCSLFYWIFFVLIKGYDMAVLMYFRYYFTSALYSVLYTFVYYYLVRWISQNTEPQKKRIYY